MPCLRTSLSYSQNHRTEQQVDDKTLAYIASGGDPDLFYDAREYNGKDSSTLDVFFNMLELLVRDDGDTAAEERRHNEGEFMSKFISVRDLMNQTKAKFMEMHKEGVVYDSCREYQYAKQNQLVDKDKDHIVMPCEETVYLAFVPSNPFSEAAARLTGRVGLTRAVQRRSLTREHVDTHYCHKIRKNVREWVILVVKVCDECKLDADKFAADFSLDDKAKVSVGEPGHPATAGARPNKKAIVGVGQELRCADHDTGVVANVVPAVQLRMDLPKNTTDPTT